MTSTDLPSRLARRRSPTPADPARAAAQGATGPVRVRRLSGVQRWWIRRAAGTALLGTAVALGLDLLAPAPPPGIQVWAAASDLPAGHVLSAEDLQASWLTGPGAEALVATDPAETVGLPLAVAVTAGTPVTATMVVGPSLISQAPAGTVVVSVPLPSASQARLAQPGTRVTFLHTPAGSHQASMVGSAVVLATSFDDDATTSMFATTDATSAAVAYVAATPQAASVLAGAAATGTLTVVAGD